MCSYGTKNIENLTIHVCKVHKSDPNFHVYCELCLRSYTKWDSYRKHLQRGCSAIHSTTLDSPTYPEVDTDEIASENWDRMEQDTSVAEENVIIQDDWYEAKYILNIKEKYILSQVAVDQIISSTKTLVSDILGGITDTIQGSVPLDVMELIQNEIDKVNTTLFQRLSSAALQKKYFQKYFNLIVSIIIIIMPSIRTCTFFGYKEPVAITLGKTIKWRKRKSGSRAVTVEDSFQFVPLMESLKV